MSAGELDVEVVDAFVHQGVGYYVLRVTSPLSRWHTTKRFSSFAVLRKELETTIPAAELPGVPGTGGKSGTSKATLEARTVALNSHLKSLTEHPKICRSFELLNFLGREDAPLPGKYRPLTGVEAASGAAAGAAEEKRE